ncbi:hypothetical protein M885DRAFT_619180 [Pelagophyceae sp. CCMP2097]|nr:hypothetical protein M885DRAFT_619180 [Pelagophyceae sp. CCMP2097]
MAMRCALVGVAVCSGFLAPKPLRSATVGFSYQGNQHDYSRAEGDDDNMIDVGLVDKLLAERVSFKKRRMFDDADKIRDVLRYDHGVTIWDRERMWTTGQDKRPSEGRAPMRYEFTGDPSSMDAPTMREIESKIEQRSRAKGKRDFAVADDLADLLRDKFNVQVDDREKTWHVHQFRSQDRREDDAAFSRTPRDYAIAEDSAILASEDEETVRRLVADRSTAKRNRDFNEADGIRDELIEDFDVYINDKTKEWRVGKPSFSSSDRRQDREEKPFQRRGGGDLTVDQVEMITIAVAERDTAKRSRRFDVADGIRDELRDVYQVTVDDRSREWRVMSDEYVYAKSSFDELDAATVSLVDKLVNDRAVAKGRRDYDVADRIREDLRDRYNVLVDDRVREWSVGAPANDFGREDDFARGAETSQRSAFKQQSIFDELLGVETSDSSVEDDVENDDLMSGEDPSEDEADLMDDDLAFAPGIMDADDVPVKATKAAAKAPAAKAAAAPAAASSGAVDVEALSALTVPQLKERLKAAGLKVSGLKAEIVDRLAAHLQAQ